MKSFTDINAVVFKESDKKRFWNKVLPTDGCWNWTAGGIKNYGLFSVGQGRGRNLFAHRVSYFFSYGSISNELLICHSCDNPSCVRPDHLFQGSYQDNVTDMMNKGRFKPGMYTTNHPEECQGERNSNSKLTKEQVIALREERETLGTSYPKLANKFGISWNQAHRIVKRVSWDHI